jgi:dihydroflavonol-4-reductase
MRVCVTGATGFVGAHLTAKLVRAGHEVRVTVRDRRRLEALKGLDVEPVNADILDRGSLRRAVRGCDMLFHAAGMVASRPERQVWRVNAVAPRIAVEVAADAGLRRVIVTSSVAGVGPARGGRPADERQSYPQAGTGMLYPDAKHEGELAALTTGPRAGIDVVAVCPSYVLGPAYNRSLPGETSTRIVANYLRGRLPAIVDSYTNIVDVEDVAEGHLLAARRGVPGERYILGGENLRWSEVIERITRLSGIHHPLVVLPPELASTAGVLRKLPMPSSLLEGIRLMAPEWRYSSARARRELKYQPRGANDTLKRTVDWYLELIEDDRLPARTSRTFDLMSAWVRNAERFGLLFPLKAAGQVARRRVVI